MANGISTLFRDVVLLILLVVAAALILLLPHVNPKGKEAEASMEPPGSVIVEMRWADDSRVDLDMWVQAPGDVPVGYSNKGGLIFNLLRDDLGAYGDPMQLNYETSFSRGIPPGEYTVNVHLFRRSSAPLPVPVEVQVSVKDADGKVKRLIHTQRELKREGEELTVLRFRLRDDGSLIPGSTHDTPKPLRSARKS